MNKPAAHPTMTPTFAENDMLRVDNKRAFRVVKVLGIGGMGEVYLTMNQALAAPCVIKTLKPEAARKTPGLRSRFTNESKVLARIRHPNVVRVFDRGSIDRGPGADSVECYMMDFLDGAVGFREMLGVRKFRLHSALDFGAQLFRGLHGVHENGVIHRDIKPENMLLHKEGGEQYAKIIDFGIMQLLADDARGEGFIGTAHYAAPEQLREEKLTEKVDIFAGGAVLFELLTRRRAFEVKSYELHSLLLRAATPAPSLASHGEFPEDLVTLVAATMDLDPRKRPDAQTVNKRLKAIARGLPTYEVQRIVTSDGALQDPSMNVQHITQADLDNATEPDGLVLPWMAEAVKTLPKPDSGRLPELGDTRVRPAQAPINGLRETNVDPAWSPTQPAIQNKTAPLPGPARPSPSPSAGDFRALPTSEYRPPAGRRAPKNDTEPVYSSPRAPSVTPGAPPVSVARVVPGANPPKAKTDHRIVVAALVGALVAFVVLGVLAFATRSKKAGPP